MLRGGMIPQAYEYPPEMRAARDLLRRRIYIVRKRSKFLSHIQNTNYQYNLGPIGKDIAYQGNKICLNDHFLNPIVQISIDTDIQLVTAMESQ